MRRKKFVLKQNNSTFALNITSMTDMFTIMLVFLLQTYSTADVQVIPEKNISLPISNSESSPIKALTVSLSKEELKLEGQTIASLKEGDFLPTDLGEQDGNFIRPLFNKLDQIKNDENNKEGKLFIQAERTLPYFLIKKVMYTSSMAGFPQVKIATVAGE